MACDPIEGTLVMPDQPLRVKRDDGFKVRFYKGDYPMKVSLAKNKKSIHVQIDRKGITTHVTLKVPPGAQVPENGRFELLGKNSGQTFDVAGNVKTTKVQSESIQEWEGCIYYRDEYVCRRRRDRRHPRRDDRRRPPRRECRWERVPVEGSRDVEFHYLTTTVRFSSQLSSPGEGTGTFAGRKVNREKIYTYRGRCL